MKYVTRSMQGTEKVEEETGSEVEDVPKRVGTSFRQPILAGEQPLL